MRQHRLLMLAALTLVLVAGAVLGERVRGGGGEEAESLRVRGSLGPTEGPSVDGYVAAKRAHLEQEATAGPDRPAAALVSLARMTTAAQALGLAGEARVEALFVRPPEGSPDAIAADPDLPGALAEWSKRAAVTLEAEAGQLSELARTAEPEDRERHLQAAERKRAAAARLGPDCPCVYAMVVAGRTLAQLRALQHDPAVRLVDVTDPVSQDLGGWELAPILPSS